MSTTATFNHIDISSQPATISKPWTKVDGGGVSYDHVTVTRSVHDLRAISSPTTTTGNNNNNIYTTDTAGFQTLQHPSPSPIDFANDASVRGAYYAEVTDLLTAQCNALPSARSAGAKVSRVVIFDHTIRRRVPGAPRGPVQQVHVDQTPAAAEARVRRHLAREEAEEALALARGGEGEGNGGRRRRRKRFQLINVWRPIAHAAADHPLAVVDWRSTDTRDFVPVDLLYPKRADSVMGGSGSEGSGGGEDDDDDRGKEKLPDVDVERFDTSGYEVRGETLGVLANEKHRFYYVKDMRPDEVFLLKCYDSWGEGEPDGKEGLAPRAPHTAFVDPATPADAKPRESIEVRALVFYDA